MFVLVQNSLSFPWDAGEKYSVKLWILHIFFMLFLSCNSLDFIMSNPLECLNTARVIFADGDFSFFPPKTSVNLLDLLKKNMINIKIHYF